MSAVVREGDPSAEVMLVTKSTDDNLQTLSGRPLNAGGAMVLDDLALEEAVGSLVRLPGWDPRLTSAAESLPVPPEWAGHPVLDYLHPLVMTPTAPGVYEGPLDGPGRSWQIKYDAKLGLEVDG